MAFQQIFTHGGYPQPSSQQAHAGDGTTK